jgi:histidinol dehydrogenase
MPRELDARDPGFEAAFRAFLAADRAPEDDVAGTVAAILADVRARGDIALADYTRRFDRVDLAATGLEITAAEIDRAVAETPAATVRALETAARRIADFHGRQSFPTLDYVDDQGVRLGARWTPVDAAGLYTPGGLAAYPSSVLMNAIPAKVAGVGRLAMTVPTPDGRIKPAVLAAARIAGVDRVYRVGGAQAIAALAWGTETIAPVDKIVGPGNAFVAEAKRQVFGTVGIDMVAGPSEILVVADGANDPAWIAADLLSQAEHDAVAQAILITDDADFARAVARAADVHLQRLPRTDIAGRSWADHGALITVGALDDAPALVDRIAPEHLELAVADPDALMAKIRHAGSIFLGRRTPEAIGDYVAGPNHVLPTGRGARFASGLNTADFMKRTTFLACDDRALAAIGPAAAALAVEEGLDAHALSVTIRLDGDDHPPAAAAAGDD